MQRNSEQKQTPNWGRAGFIRGSKVKFAPESDDLMCSEHSKYLCLCKVQLFPLISDLRVLRDTLGPHFERFSGSLGSILVIWMSPGNRLEFGWIPGPSLGPPWTKGTKGLVVKW